MTSVKEHYSVPSMDSLVLIEVRAEPRDDIFSCRRLVDELDNIFFRDTEAADQIVGEEMQVIYTASQGLDFR